MQSSRAFPKKVCIHVEGPSPAGLAVVLSFKMKWKNRFSYMLFLDRNGNAQVFGEQLLRYFDQERATFIMDYCDPRLGFTGDISAQVLGTSELQNAWQALEMFRGKIWYPEGYEEKLQRALQQRPYPEKYQISMDIL